ncbi:response regulator [Paenibacillus rhizovicinus]|uniref:Response regulator n=1 Tax=Paenibacillus rhizovicinus TaxID=2704463 RepID=A0A6C0P151_9BACL|nr:response regulator [Paenibacillus rhizovicinus]QHW32205.1 response regulator [Paenibacillus rhizovicinus]
MYKLLLADDEADVREGILQEIEWEAEGFQVVDVAENGREALEMAERWMPDVLVTDIRMPFMDGLKLSEQIRGLMPGTKIIILTGFDEFEYARQAIHLKVEEFVLKPFSAEELVQALRRVKSRLEAEMSERENVDALREHYNKSLPLLREVFLGTLVTRKLSEREIEEKIEHYDLALRGACCTVSVLLLDGSESGTGSSGNIKAPGDNEPAAVRPAGLSLYESRDFELRRFAVRNIAEEIVGRRLAGYVFQHNERVVVLTAAPAAAVSTGEHAAAAEPIATADREHNQTPQLLEEIRQNVERYLKLTVTIGTSSAAFPLTGLKAAYDDAIAALDYRMLLGSNRVISIEDVETRHAAHVRFDELHEQSLLRCLKVGTVSEMSMIVDQLFSPFLNSGSPVSFLDAQVFLLQLSTTMLKAAQDTDNGPGGFGGTSGTPSPNILKELIQFGSMHEAKNWVVSTCEAMMGRIAAGRQTAYHSLVEEARSYTKANYADSEINIAKICAVLHISAGYFSSIFKRETKMTYMGYLLHVRMEAAKDLLLTTDLKTFEIAEKVGYADPNYFSFSFKKHVGQSPKDYRNGAGRDAVQ